MVTRLTRHIIPMYDKTYGDRAVKLEKWPISSFGLSVTMISARENVTNDSPSEYVRPAPDPEHDDERHGEGGTGGNLQMHGQNFSCDDADDGLGLVMIMVIMMREKN